MIYWVIGELRLFSRLSFFQQCRRCLSSWLTSVALLSALLYPAFCLGRSEDTATSTASSLSAEEAQTLDQLTQTLLGQGRSSQFGVANSKQSLEEGQSSTDLLSIAATRRQLLASLMESHPEEVLRVAIPKSLRASMPASVQAFVEEEVKIEGEVEVISKCDGVTHDFSYFLNTKDKQLSLHFAGPQPKNIQTGGRFRVSGVRVNESIALRGKKKTFSPLSAPPLSALGEQRVAVLLVNFRNNPSTPYSVDEVRNLVFNTTNNFIRENSQQQTWLTGDVLGWYTIDFDTSVCNSFQIRDNAHAAAAATGVNLSSYSRYIYVFPYVACIGVPGSGTVGGNPSRIWVNGSLSLRTIGHELGHNLGLFHSFALDCGTATYGANCTKIEYGDTLDIMGYPGVVGHYSAPQKEKLGWTGDTTATVTVDGTYILSPYENAVADNPQVLKILQSINPVSGKKTWYYLEYRQPTGFDSFLSSNTNMRNGVVVHLGSEDTTIPYSLLDATPETASWNDPALGVGRSFSDPKTGLTIQTLWANATGAAVNVVNSSVGGLSCTQNVPTVTITPGQSVGVTAGTKVSYTVSVKNNDSSDCQKTTFSLQKAVPSGWTSGLSSTQLVISPGATASTVLQVTSPPSAIDGAYAINVAMTSTTALGGRIVNLATGTQTAAATATYVIASGPGLSALTDKSTYVRPSWVSVTAKVRAANQSVSKATVTFTLIKPNAQIYKKVISTGTTGSALFKFALQKSDPVGTYQVIVQATKTGLTFSDTTVNFTVQ